MKFSKIKLSKSGTLECTYKNEDGDIVQFTINAEHNASYFILNTSYIGADSIITINEPIE